MKKIFIIFLSISAMSCNDFLEVDLPNDQLTADLVFKDAQLAKAAMAGVYRSLEEKGFLSGSSMGGAVYMGCYSDELISYEVSTSNLSQFFHTTVNPQSNVIKNLWNDSYAQIYAVNRIIAGLDGSVGIDSTVKNSLLGEAYFLRAFLHFYLAQAFDDVPYVTSADYRENTKISKESVAEVMMMALEDLSLSEGLIVGQSVAGARIRPTKMAVYALQSRIHLYLQNWDDAITTSSKVIAQETYIVETDLTKTFKKESRSSIWQLEPLRAGNNTREAALYTIFSAPPTQVSLALDLVNSFEAFDQRKQNWIGAKNDLQQNTFFFASKYKQANVSPTTLEHSIVLRVEEQYLIRAEAYHKKQLNALAVADVNVLRSRAGLPLLTETSGSQMMAVILNERRHELFTEFGHRFYDLKRLGLLDERMAFKPQWKTFNRNLPLPESELLLNPNLAPQNNGY